MPPPAGRALEQGRRPTTEGAAIDADLATLAGLVGAQVRVGGIVVALDGDRVLVDDGTATGGIQLAGDAAALLPLLEPGDAVSAVGRVAVGRRPFRSSGSSTPRAWSGSAISGRPCRSTPA